MTLQKADTNASQAVFQHSVKRDLTASEISGLVRLIIRDDAATLLTNHDKCHSVVRIWNSLFNTPNPCQQDNPDDYHELLNAFDEILSWNGSPQNNEEYLRRRFAYIRLAIVIECLKKRYRGGPARPSGRGQNSNPYDIYCRKRGFPKDERSQSKLRNHM